MVCFYKLKKFNFNTPWYFRSAELLDLFPFSFIWKDFQDNPSKNNEAYLCHSWSEGRGAVWKAFTTRTGVSRFLLCCVITLSPDYDPLQSLPWSSAVILAKKTPRGERVGALQGNIRLRQNGERKKPFGTMKISFELSTKIRTGNVETQAAFKIYWS